MKKKVQYLPFLALALLLLQISINATQDEPDKVSKTPVYDRIYAEAEKVDSVRMITYEQFIEIRESGEKVVLIDVLLEDSYNQGHIEGAINFPIPTIDKENAAEKLNKDDKIIVYCASSHCKASYQAALTLMAHGYTVLDYRGGIFEWTQKGNQLVTVPSKKEQPPQD